MGVDSFASEVGSLAKHGGVLAAHARVKVVLADTLHHVGRGAVEEMPLAQKPVHLGETTRHVFLLPVRQREREIVCYSLVFIIVRMHFIHLLSLYT